MLDAFLAGSPPHAGGPADVLPQFLKAPTPLGAAQQAVENALLAPFGWRRAPGMPGGRAPERTAGGHDHAGADPVTATSARTRRALRSRRPAGFPGGPRLAWLHLRSCRVPAGVLALALCGGLLHAALRFNWTFNSGRYAQLVPVIIAAAPPR